MYFYYLDDNDDQQGPFTPQELSTLWKERKINEKTLARSERIQEWVPITCFADHVPGFYTEGVDGHRDPKKLKHPGYRFFVMCLRNPGAVVFWIVLAGGVIQLFRELAVLWIFPPNRLPAP